MIKRNFWYKEKDEYFQVTQADLPTINKSLVVLGEAGMGKSCLLEWLGSLDNFAYCTARQLLYRHKPNYLLNNKKVLYIKASKTVSNLVEILKENGIKAVYSLAFNDKKMQEIDGQYFYVYEWYDGKSLKDGEITKYHCEEMGKVLAKIHNIDLVNKD
jgi:hypothetical protein